VCAAGYYRTNNPSWGERKDPAARPDLAAETPVHNIVMVTPNSPLPVSKNWVLQVLKGLPNAGASASLGDEFSYPIGEVEDFRVTGMSAHVSTDLPRSIILNSNEQIPKDFKADWVSVTPAPQGMTLETDGKSLSIKRDFSQNDSYIVALANGVVSADGRKLANRGNMELKFERLDAELALSSDTEGQLAHGLRKYEISTVNLSSVKVRIKRLSGKGAIRALQGYRQYSGRGPNYTRVEPTSTLPYSLVPGETIIEKEIELGTKVDTGKNINLSWDELLPAGTDFASLFVDVIGTPHPEANSNGRRNVQAIVQLTDIGLAWKFTEMEALIFAFS
jgi:hypothetical protein